MPEDLVAFEERASEWLAANAPMFCGESRRVSLCGAMAPQEQADEVERRARGWEARKARDGWAGLAVPQEPGGRGALPTRRRSSRISRAPTRCRWTSSLSRRGWVIPTLLAWGTEEQKAGFIPRALDGSELWCQLSSEPGAGSDLAALATRAEKRDHRVRHRHAH